MGLFTYFNPRTSYEVRRHDILDESGDVEFQSTHLLRGATRRLFPNFERASISIHAPLTRCDERGLPGLRRARHFNPRTSYEVRRHQFFHFKRLPANFNPRTSYEVRRPCRTTGQCSAIFQSTHLLRGATRRGDSIDLTSPDFNPRTSYEVRLKPVSKSQCAAGFQSTHLLRGATISSIAAFAS